MPIITFEGGKLDRAQKAELVQRFTEAAHQITGIPREAFVVLVKENHPENIGVGGVLLAERQKAKEE